MKLFAVTFIYVSFFVLIGMVCYVTKSGLPLWAILLTPDFLNFDCDCQSLSIGCTPRSFAGKNSK
jgi:hypothetical protein